MATHYMSPTGNDANTGAINSPWLTLSASSLKLSAGDFLYLRGGTYNQTGVNWHATIGTATSPITVIAYPGETPVFEGSNALNGFIVAGAGNGASSYTIFDGWTVQNFGVRGTPASGSGIYFSYPGSGATRATGNIVRNCTLKNIGSNITQDHGIYFSYGCVSCEANNNVFINIAGGAIQTWHSPGIQGAEFYNNQVFGANWGVVMGDGANNVHIDNNLFVNCINAGIDGSLAGELDNASFPASYTINLRGQNNIFRACNIGVNMSANATTPLFSNNLHFGNTANYSGASSTLDVLADPKFVSYAIDGTGNYHLLASSPAINAANTSVAPTVDFDGVLRPQGPASDIGPYEFLSAANSQFFTVFSMG